jgi:hypothetical protein
MAPFLGPLLFSRGRGREVIEITSKFEADDDAFVIGGQATNFWAWFYQDKEPALKLKGPFTSEDIDYFGTQDVARNVAGALFAHHRD